MVSVVDALMISVGMDASAYLKGSKDVNSALDKTKDAAKKTGKEVEDVAKKMASGLSDVATAGLELVAIFTGGKTFKDFIEGAVKANNAVGMLSNSLGTSPELLGAWGVAAQRMGGSAAAAQASIQGLSDRLVDLRTQGKALPNELFLLQAQSGVNVDWAHGYEKLMIDLAKAASQLAKTDPAAASRYLRSMGLDPATSALLIRQGANMARYIEQQKKLAPNDRDVAAAGRMTDAQGKLAAAYDLLAAKVMTALTPALTWLADKLSALVEIIARWVEANPGWTEAILGVFTLMSGAMALKSIGTMLRLTGALTSLTGIGMGSGIMAWLARGGLAGLGIGALVAGGVDAYDHSSAGAGEDERARHRRYNGAANDALRRRGQGADLNPGKPGKLTDNQRDAYQAARGEGLSDKAAKALVADMSGESLSNPRNVHWDGTHYAHGAVQWDDERSARIREHFGKMPQEMSVADQTKAAIWEIRTNPRFARTKRALEGDNAGAMIGALVGNYEGPADVGGAIAKRSSIYQGLGNLGQPQAHGQDGDADYRAHRGGKVPMPIMKGDPSLAGKTSMLVGGARQAAALNNIANDNRATTSTSSQEMHIGAVNVHTAATDADGIAGSMAKALRHNMYAQTANYGPA